MGQNSPWMTLDEACEYAKRSRETVRRAAVEYQRTKGADGLLGHQRAANAWWRFHVDDLDRWIRGEAPARNTRQTARAS